MPSHLRYGCNPHSPHTQFRFAERKIFAIMTF
nr:MAG TPA: bifunctional purine biosynthesis protein [Caudoviricetes sp.]